MPGRIKRNKRPTTQWLMIVLIVGVLVLSSLAFIKPVSQAQPLEPTPTGTEAPPAEQTAGAETPTSETIEAPPTPEEIGYTDGIIFCSTVLILILLVGTLRETLRWKAG